MGKVWNGAPQNLMAVWYHGISGPHSSGIPRTMSRRRSKEGIKIYFKKTEKFKKNSRKISEIEEKKLQKNFQLQLLQVKRARSRGVWLSRHLFRYATATFNKIIIAISNVMVKRSITRKAPKAASEKKSRSDYHLNENPICLRLLPIKLFSSKFSQT